MRIPLIAANWKMHKTVQEARAYVTGLRKAIKGLNDVDLAIAPPFTALAAVAEAVTDLPVHVAGQNAHFEAKGAFTGEVAPGMLAELGCHYVILGHSERRTLFGETDEVVNRKVRAAFQHELIPILCVGESLEQREAGQTEAVLERQLRAALEGLVPNQAAKLVIAYEPIWAIGTGKTATPADAQGGCAFARRTVDAAFNSDVAGSLRVQYGGSVKPDNARELLGQPDVDGALVGGASLLADSFAGIAWAASRQ